MSTVLAIPLAARLRGKRGSEFIYRFLLYDFTKSNAPSRKNWTWSFMNNYAPPPKKNSWTCSFMNFYSSDIFAWIEHGLQVARRELWSAERTPSVCCTTSSAIPPWFRYQYIIGLKLLQFLPFFCDTLLESAHEKNLKQQFKFHTMFFIYILQMKMRVKIFIVLAK